MNAGKIKYNDEWILIEGVLDLRGDKPKYRNGFHDDWVYMALDYIQERMGIKVDIFTLYEYNGRRERPFKTGNDILGVATTSEEKMAFALQYSNARQFFNDVREWCND